MPDRVEKYIHLVSRYLHGDLDYDGLWSRFNDEFVKEDGLDEEAFDILDTIWGDLEVTTSNAELLNDGTDDYLGEPELRARLAEHMDRLQNYQKGCAST